MVTRIIKLSDSFCFHARPAAILSGSAKNFESVIMITAKDKFADAKNFVSVMGLGRPNGGQIELAAEGTDEEEAVRKLEELLKTLE